MTVAAMYARFSCDAQREDSIEIQTRECAALIEREGWEPGEVYTDYAMSGRSDARPGFRLCLSDGEKRKYDVLVVYKGDRLARNVAVAQDFKRRLFESGVRIFSVREGELTDSPDGFLIGGIGDLFAEYYSRNLSVLIKGGIQQNARNLRANGQRIFGYSVGADDRYVEEPSEAATVRRIFDMYLGGWAASDIASALNREGVKPPRGAKWYTTSVMNVLRNRHYTGRYDYAGVVAEGGMPAIVPREDFDRAQSVMERRSSQRRRRSERAYPLTGLAHCLRCGKPMRGTSGTSKNGRKYAYYACPDCGTVPAGKLEDEVTDALGAAFARPEDIDALAADMKAYLGSIPDPADAWREERRALEKEVSNLVGAVSAGARSEAILSAIEAKEARIAELRSLISSTGVGRSGALCRENLEAFIADVLGGKFRDPEIMNQLYKLYIHKLFVDKTHIVMIFDFGNEPCDDDLAFAQAAVNEEHPSNRSSDGCSYSIRWWTPLFYQRTRACSWDTGFALFVNTDH